MQYPECTSINLNCQEIAHSGQTFAARGKRIITKYEESRFEQKKFDVAKKLDSKQKRFWLDEKNVECVETFLKIRRNPFLLRRRRRRWRWRRRHRRTDARNAVYKKDNVVVVDEVVFLQHSIILEVFSSLFDSWWWRRFETFLCWLQFWFKTELSQVQVSASSIHKNNPFWHLDTWL